MYLGDPDDRLDADGEVDEVEVRAIARVAAVTSRMMPVTTMAIFRPCPGSGGVVLHA
jgi:hypothetical protein